MKTNAEKQKTFRKRVKNAIGFYENITGIKKKTAMDISENKNLPLFPKHPNSLIVNIAYKLSPFIIEEAIDFITKLEEKARDSENPWDDLFFKVLKAIFREERKKTNVGHS